MKTPKMTMRRWFWVASLGALLWLVASMRFSGAGAGSQPGLQERAQQQVALTPVQALLTPISMPLTWAQTKFEALATGGRAGEPKRIEELERRLAEMANERDQMEYALRSTFERLQVYDKTLKQFPAIRPQDLRTAKVIGRSVGVGTETCTLDIGSNQGVGVGQIVLADLAPIGRIVACSQWNSTVRLITDPEDRRVRINVRLERPSDPKSEMMPRDCQVRGAGGGMLACDVNKAGGKLPPQVGDLLRVDDNDWAPVGGTVIGRVVAVSALDLSRLRYELTVKPAVDVTARTQVSVLLK